MVKSKTISKPSKNGVDRLSDLPDPLLSRILSLLPAENAVATSALSTRWKFLWTSITSLNLDERTYIKGAMKRTRFTLFVNRVLLLITPPCIQTFRLKCTDILFDPLYFNMWITVIAPTVRQLDLYLSFPKGKIMELQMNHFHFNNLVGLKLCGDIDFHIPALTSICFPCLQTLHLHFMTIEIAGTASVTFPNLKILHILDVEYENKDSVHKLEYENKDSVQKLLSSCPVLDYLLMDTGKKVLPLVFCMPSLTKLVLALRCSDEHVYEVQMDKLRKLKFLAISGHALKAILTVSANALSGFHNVKRLEIQLYDCSDSCVMIKHLLESMDNLKHITITRWHNRWHDRCSCSHGSWWTEPLNVPKCLLSRVTTISFIQAIDDCPDELEVVRYFLKNAKVLQSLKLGTECCSSERKLKLIEKVSKFPKGSKACQVEFTYKFSSYV